MTTVSTQTMVGAYVAQIREAREFLEGTMADVTLKQALWAPEGKALPISAHYAHVVTAQDMGLHGLLKGTAPLAASSWAGKTGLSEPMPFGPGVDMHGWARRVEVDLAALREYAQAVYGATDEYLAAATDDDVNRTLDLSQFGFGQQPASFILVNGWINNVWLHTGEISCLKGLQGAKGYPV